jgi:hypothetical protein
LDFNHNGIAIFYIFDAINILYGSILYKTLGLLIRIFQNFYSPYAHYIEWSPTNYENDHENTGHFQCFSFGSSKYINAWSPKAICEIIQNILIFIIPVENKLSLRDFALLLTCCGRTLIKGGAELKDVVSYLQYFIHGST